MTEDIKQILLALIAAATLCFIVCEFRACEESDNQHYLDVQRDREKQSEAKK